MIKGLESLIDICDAKRVYEDREGILRVSIRELWFERL